MRLTMDAHAKINWSLAVRGVREDGYHELDMLMQSLELSDHLTFETSKWLSLSVKGKPLPVGDKNIVMKAANALNDYMGARYGARIRIEKRIPIRAGLGGGSADCAATLLALNQLWKIKLPITTLMKIGASLGADVPYCLQGGLCRVSGIGEVIRPIPGSMRVPLLIKHPGNGLSTPAVFRAWDEEPRYGAPGGMDDMESALVRGDLASAGEKSYNALEAPAVRMLPEIRRALNEMIGAGALFARMTGSGSAVFGVFSSDEDALRAKPRVPLSIFTHTVSD